MISKILAKRKVVNKNGHKRGEFELWCDAHNHAFEFFTLIIRSVAVVCTAVSAMAIASKYLLGG